MAKTTVEQNTVKHTVRQFFSSLLDGTIYLGILVGAFWGALLLFNRTVDFQPRELVFLVVLASIFCALVFIGALAFMGYAINYWSRSKKR